MSNNKKKIQKAVKRDRAEDYLLTSLIAFGVTVIAVRVFLQLTGFPQIGNSVLHIAHALWGALLLIIAVFLPLALANRWAIQVSALLSGIGIGLFIDEVGKFITQKNDYFYAPALPLIYSFFLVIVFVYLLFRRPRKDDPRKAMYHALEGLQDALDSDLDTDEEARIETQLAIARGSDLDEISSLAHAVTSYLEKEKGNLAAAKPGFWKRLSMRADAIGHRLGRKAHHTIISAILIFWSIFAIVVTVPMAWVALGGIDANSQFAQDVFTSSELAIIENSFWLSVLLILVITSAVLALVAAISWFRRNEERGLNTAILGALVSLIALQPLIFYLIQFAAVISSLILFAILLILLAYRRWYLNS